FGLAVDGLRPVARAAFAPKPGWLLPFCTSTNDSVSSVSCPSSERFSWSVTLSRAVASSAIRVGSRPRLRSSSAGPPRTAPSCSVDLSEQRLLRVTGPLLALFELVRRQVQIGRVGLHLPVHVEQRRLEVAVAQLLLRQLREEILPQLVTVGARLAGPLPLV